MTNRDKINQMSNEELAKFIQSICSYGEVIDTDEVYPSIAGIKPYLDMEANQ